MRLNLSFRFYSILFISLLTFGCAGGGEEAATQQEQQDTGNTGGDNGSGNTQNQAPTAVITAGNDGEVGTTIEANGAESSDPNGDTLSYRWELELPNGSSASLSSTTGIETSFTPDVAGNYTLVLVVNDGAVDSEAASHVVTVVEPTQSGGNTAPTAAINVADGVTLGNSVTASGASSSDTEGDTLSYSWELDTPNGSNTTLSATDTEEVTFTPDIEGTYTVKLIVNDGEFNSTQATRNVIAQAAAQGQSFKFQETSGSNQTDVPFTFATVFMKGEFPATQQFQLQLSNGGIVNVQTDAKATHNDGSLRHAVFSGVIPSLSANANLDAELVAVNNAPASNVASLTDLLNSGWDTTVTLTIDSETYQVSAADLLSSQAESLWLDGPLVKEWVVHSNFKTASNQEHAHLSARFNVRVYKDLKDVRVSVIVENNWAYQSDIKNFTYSGSIDVNGTEVYTVSDLIHLKNARWIQQFWTNNEPSLHIGHDASYLIATGAIPNYDPALIGAIDSSKVTEYDTEWTEEVVTIEVGDNGYPVPLGSGGTPFTYNKIGPMGVGFANNAMPTTGARPDIGPLPAWHAIYLLDQTKASKKVALGMGDTAGSWPIHYRHQATGLPLSIDDFPYATSHSNINLSKNPTTGEFEQTAQCTSAIVADCLSPYRPDTAHQPSLAYVPYLVSGDEYYLEELHFWANYNFLTMNPGYRGLENGWFERSLQDRGQAWSMRTLGHAAFITPDNHPMKNYFSSKLQANLDKYHEKYLVNEPNSFGSMIPNYSHPTHSPWMDDFFTWSIGHLVELDFQDAVGLLEFKAKFPVQRMGFGTNDPNDYCWIFASAYHLLIAPEKNAPMFTTIKEVYDNTNGQSIPYGGAFNDHGTACASQEQADALGLQQGEMIGYSGSPTGFPSNLQIALAAAADSGIEGAAEAWQRFMNRSVKPDYSAYPNYGIVPRN